MKKSFNLGRAISFSLQSLRKYPLLIMTPVAFQTIIMVGCTAGMDLYTKLSLTKSPENLTQPGLILLMFLGLMFMLAIYFLGLVITQIIIIRVGFKIFHKEEPVWKDVRFLERSLVGRFFVNGLLLGLYILLALLIGLIPGIIIFFLTRNLFPILRYFLLMFCFIPVIYIYATYYFVALNTVDSKDFTLQIFQKSASLTKGVKWYIFGFLLLIFSLSFPITRSIMSLKNHGLVWQYYSLYGVFTFLWTSLVAMIPVYLYKDLMRQQTQIEMGDILAPTGENLVQELEQDQAEELVEESPEL